VATAQHFCSGFARQPLTVTVSVQYRVQNPASDERGCGNMFGVQAIGRSLE